MDAFAYGFDDALGLLVLLGLAWFVWWVLGRVARRTNTSRLTVLFSLFVVPRL